MKTIAGLLSLALLLLPQVGVVFAQTSDYEIIETFKQRNRFLTESLATVQDPVRNAELMREVGRLESEFAPHRTLLAEGLYPGTFDAAVAALKEQARSATERIALAEERQRDKAQLEANARTIGEITQQNVEYRASVEQLTLKVSDLSAQIEKLTAENTGLLAQVRTLQLENKRDKESIAKLQQLTDKLNANVRDRDALVLKMMDGLFQEYGKAGLTDAQRKDLFVNAQGNDYVGTIVATIDGNVKYADTGLLAAKDVQQVREQQQKLAVKWEQIKPLVEKLYPDEQARLRDIATVDSRIADWKKSLGEATWKSIHQAFVAQKVDIGQFSNAEEFHARLVAYLDAQAQSPSRQQYRTFTQRVWESPMKDQWLPIISPEELSPEQRSDIERRIALWGEKVSAIVRKWLLVALFGVALAVTAGVILRRRKQPAVTA